MDDQRDRRAIIKPASGWWRLVVGPGGGTRPWGMVIALALTMSGCGDRSGSQASAPEADGVVVFAAASTGDVIREIADRYEAKRSVPVKISLAATSTLAKQIVAGASPDVFLSASSRWMDFVAQKGRIRLETRRDLLRNEMVLIAPMRSDLSVTPSADFSIAEAFSGRFAIANPEHVPAGRYGRAALERLGWWSALEGRAITALDVRMALRFVERGEAGAGIVYRTDAMASDRVRIVSEIPSTDQTDIRYPVALCQDASTEGAAFLEFLRGGWARRRFEEAGFSIISGELAVVAGGCRP